jgi:hypothetical protein
MGKAVIDNIVKIQLFQIQGGQSAIGVKCDSYRRTMATTQKQQIPTLYPPRKESNFKKSGALDNALGKPTSLSIKNPRPLLQMVTAAEVAAAQEEALSPLAPNSPEHTEADNAPKRSWKMALLRTIEDCYECVVEYEDMRYANGEGLSEADKTEMAQLMTTLMDRAFGTFTSLGNESDGAASEQNNGSRVNADVLAAVCSIPKGLRLLTRLVPLLPHDGTWTNAHEMITAIMLNGQRISQLCTDEAAQQKLVASVTSKLAQMDLLAIRGLLKQAVEQFQSSQDHGASSIFSPIGCGLLAGMVLRGHQCISIGLSSDRSRAQWKAVSEQVVTCAMIKFSQGPDWINHVGSFGADLLREITKICDQENPDQKNFYDYLEQNLVK